MGSELGWEQFPVYVMEVEVEVERPVRFPPYAGSLFRGVLGWSLREVCAPAAYEYLFETTSEQSGQHDAPRPFLLVPPPGDRQLWEGDRCSFTLKLLGQGCDYVSEFVAAVEHAGTLGLGSRRAPFHVTRIVVQEGWRKWVAFDQALGWGRAYFPLPSALATFAIPPSEALVDELEVEFQTPTSLVHLGKRVSRPDFHVVLRALYRRLDSLLNHHGGARLGVDFREDIRAAQEVAARFSLRWQDWERTSGRQNRRHPLGGVVGTASYHGEFAPWWVEMLGAARVLHLGKGTTFGMGSCQVRASA